jgi:predicted nuclease of predicted toxin-antitoxin system
VSWPLLVDENFPAPSTKRLRDDGYDVFSVAELMPGASDLAVMAHARELARWLVTFDRDYGELVFVQGLPPPPAIILLRQVPVPPDAPASWLKSLLADPDLAPGSFIAIDGRTTRRRALPGCP